MNNFKAGDLVKRKEGGVFSNGSLEVKVINKPAHTRCNPPDGNSVWLDTCTGGTYTDYKDIELVNKPKFKIGDVIISISDKGTDIKIGGIYTVTCYLDSMVSFMDDNGDVRIRHSMDYELYEEEPKEDTSKWHKHHDLIIAWAKGAKVQFKCKVDNKWHDVVNGYSWHDSYEYRIKPKASQKEISELESQIKELSEKLKQMKGE